MWENSIFDLDSQFFSAIPSFPFRMQVTLIRPSPIPIKVNESFATDFNYIRISPVLHSYGMPDHCKLYYFIPNMLCKIYNTACITDYCGPEVSSLHQVEFGFQGTSKPFSTNTSKANRGNTLKAET